MASFTARESLNRQPKIVLILENVEFCVASICCVLALYAAANATAVNGLPLGFLAGLYVVTAKFLMHHGFPRIRTVLFTVANVVDFGLWAWIIYPEICYWWAFSPLQPDPTAPGQCACLQGGSLPDLSGAISVRCVAMTLLSGLIGGSAIVAHRCRSRRHARLEFLRLLTMREREKIQARLRKAAEMAIMKRRQFMAYIFHELRVPFHTISLGLGELQCSDLSSQDQATLELMVQSGDQMQRVMDDVLDASRVEEGRMPLTMTSFSTRDLLRRIFEHGRGSTTVRQQALSYHSCDDYMVVGDPVRITQVGLNLLSNAAKFTKRHGIITLSSSAKVMTLNKAREELKSIHDSWLGMIKAEAEKEPNVFRHQSSDRVPPRLSQIGSTRQRRGCCSNFYRVLAYDVNVTTGSSSRNYSSQVLKDEKEEEGKTQLVRKDTVFSEPGNTKCVLLRISVTDSGPGIAKSDQERIFSAYVSTMLC